LAYEAQVRQQIPKILAAVRRLKKGAA